jgi:hypothetical protein
MADDNIEEEYPESCDSKHDAQKALRRLNYGIITTDEPRIYWRRMLVIEPSDYVVKIPKKSKTIDIRNMDIFDGTVEGADYRNCPWAGRANLIWFDDKYEVYHINRFSGINGEEGFYLVDINARRK